MSLQNFEKLFKIPRFYKIDASLYRGGQPSLNDIRNLKNAGFKSIVSLRSKKNSLMEREFVETLEMKFFNIPLSYFWAPEMKEIELFFSYFEDPENLPLFVHCFYGVDRTGFVAAMYRIKKCGWTFEEAYEEMIACGFHKVQVRHYINALEVLALKS